MVLKPVSSCSQQDSQLETRHAPLKRRGLSKFYSSKSQSFSNIPRDVLSNPFCRSSVLLAKHTLDGSRSCGSICETAPLSAAGMALSKMDEDTELQFAEGRSWDVECSVRIRPAAAAAVAAPSCTPELQVCQEYAHWAADLCQALTHLAVPSCPLQSSSLVERELGRHMVVVGTSASCE
jgi:hypothetical protein